MAVLRGIRRKQNGERNKIRLASSKSGAILFSYEKTRKLEGPMKWTYRCPHCRAHLNPGESAIILSATGDAGRGLFLFNAAPGDYELVLPEGIALEKGQKWEFSCPICRENLISAADGNIATIPAVRRGRKRTCRLLFQNRRGTLHVRGQRRGSFRLRTSCESIRANGVGQILLADISVSYLVISICSEDNRQEILCPRQLLAKGSDVC